MPDSALDGIKVLDLTHHFAGPYCTKLLADYGAEVMKIERPVTGDPARMIGPFAGDDPHPDKSLPFAYLNTSKKSVTLNLKSEEGRRIMMRLIEDADLLVENFSPRVMPSLGLDYDTLRAVNPSLVMVSISNFGQDGPYRDYRATDIVAYALGGLMYIFGENGMPPLKHALRQAQFKAGTNAAGAALIALMHRDFTGAGQHVDVSVHEAMASAMRDTTSLYAYSGAIRGRQPAASGEIPRAPLEASDGYVVPIFLGGVSWNDMAAFLGSDELASERYSTASGRVANAEALQDAAEAAFKRRTKREWFEDAHARRYPFGIVNSPEEVVDNPQFRAREFFQDIEHPVAGTLAMPGAPFRMSETPWRAWSPAPSLGQHNLEVLCGRLGCSQSDVKRLAAEGVI